jgi:adenosylhomocysteine nucleosidase
MPFSETDSRVNCGISINDLPAGICSTGDSFETNRRSADYDVIDMEAYALAFVAMKEQIPFLWPEVYFGWCPWRGR